MVAILATAFAAALLAPSAQAADAAPENVSATSGVYAVLGTIPENQVSRPSFLSRNRAPLALVAGSALFGGAAYLLHQRSLTAYDAYKATHGDFDRHWAGVQHWEFARDASLFTACVCALSAFVAATPGFDPGAGSLFGVMPDGDRVVAFATTRF